MTAWHRDWQEICKPECTEVRIDNGTGEFHIADIKTPAGLTIEIQHSPLKPSDVSAREQFYGRMIWIVDATKYPVLLTGKLAGTKFVIFKVPKFWNTTTMSVFLDRGDKHVYRVMERTFGADDFALCVAVNKREMVTSMFGTGLKSDKPQLNEKQESLSVSDLEMVYDTNQNTNVYVTFRGDTFKFRDVFRQLNMTWEPVTKVWGKLFLDAPLTICTRTFRSFFEPSDVDADQEWPIDECYNHHERGPDWHTASGFNWTYRPLTSVVTDQRETEPGFKDHLMFCHLCCRNDFKAHWRNDRCRLLFLDGECLYGTVEGGLST